MTQNKKPGTPGQMIFATASYGIETSNERSNQIAMDINAKEAVNMTNTAISDMNHLLYDTNNA